MTKILQNSLRCLLSLGIITISCSIDVDSSLQPNLCAQVTDARTDASGKDMASTIEWVQLHALAIESLDPDRGVDEFGQFDHVVGNARILALGEATHGTHEFFIFKRDMVQFVASKGKFTVFSIEANMPEAFRLNDFVLYGIGNPRQLIAGMHFWTWDTDEVLGMVLWMRTFNQSGKGRIEFTGFDMQSPEESIGIVQSFVKQNEPSYLGFVRDAYIGVSKMYLFRESTSIQEPGQTASPEHEDSVFNPRESESLCGDVLEHLKSKYAYYLTRSGKNQIDWIIQNAHLILQFIQYRLSQKSRDELMAANIEWIADRYSDARIVVWAHNNHVRFGEAAGYHSMGEYLRRDFGQGYLSLGLIFDVGSFRAKQEGRGELREFHVAPAPQLSLDAVLAASGFSQFVLDLRQIPKSGPVADWFNRRHLTRSIGAFYDDRRASDFYVYIRVQDAFDGIFFVRNTTASHPID